MLSYKYKDITLLAGYNYWFIGEGSKLNDFNYILPISGMEFGIRYNSGNINKKISLFTEADFQFSLKNNIKDFHYRRYESIVVRETFNTYTIDTLVLNGTAIAPVDYTRAKFFEFSLGYGINYGFSKSIYLVASANIGLGLRIYEDKFKGFDLISVNEWGPLLMFKTGIGYCLF